MGKLWIMKQKSTTHPENFRSLRWRLTLPIFIVLIIGSALTFHLATQTLTRALRDSELSTLDANAQLASARALTFGQEQRDALQKIAEQVTLATAKDTLEPAAMVARLDYLFIADQKFQDVSGIERTDSGYEPIENAALGSLGITQGAQSSRRAVSGLVQTEHGYVLLTAYPLVDGSMIIGGVRIKEAAFAIQPAPNTQIALYGPNGETLFNPFYDVPDSAIAYTQTNEKIVLNTRYSVRFLPLVVDSAPVGTVGIYMINGWYGATEAGRNVLIGGLILISLAVMSLLYLRVRRTVRRVETITATAQRLITDNPRARTQFTATDEIGELGATVDYFANHEQEIRRHLHDVLHEQSREISELEALFDATARELTSRDAELERLVDQVCSLEFNPFMQRPIELEELIWNVVGELQAQASRQLVTIQVMVQRHDQFVLCEEWRLRWALGGLLDAAVRSTKRSEGVSIRLDMSEDERYARIDFRASRVSPTRVNLAKRLIDSCGGVMTGERGEWRILLPLTVDVPFRHHRDEVTRQSNATLHLEQDED